MLQTSGRFIEWGWILGYDANGGYNSTPGLLLCWKNLSAPFDCAEGLGGIGAGQNVTFTVQDTNQDNTWSVYLYSYLDLVDTVTLDFDQGQLYTNGERDSCDDIPWSHFNSLKKYHINDSSYANWAAHYQLVDSDPNYRYRIVSNTESYVERANNNACP
jgi:hypothetical protein